MLVAPIGESEIVILGGHSGKFLSDGFLFNTKHKQVKRILKKDHFKFSSVGN